MAKCLTADIGQHGIGRTDLVARGRSTPDSRFPVIEQRMFFQPQGAADGDFGPPKCMKRIGE